MTKGNQKPQTEVTKRKKFVRTKPSPHAARAEAILLSDIATRRSLIRTLPGISAKQKAHLTKDVEALEWVINQISAKEGR